MHPRHPTPPRIRPFATYQETPVLFLPEAHAWPDDEQAKYAHFLDKRRRMEAVEQENIAALIAEEHGGGSIASRAK